MGGPHMSFRPTGEISKRATEEEISFSVRNDSRKWMGFLAELKETHKIFGEGENESAIELYFFTAQHP